MRVDHSYLTSFQSLYFIIEFTLAARLLGSVHLTLQVSYLLLEFLLFLVDFYLFGERVFLLYHETMDLSTGNLGVFRKLAGCTPGRAVEYIMINNKYGNLSQN